MRPTWLIGMMACVAIAAHAQPQEKVLRGAELTENALIDLLEIEAPPEVSGTRRGFRAARALEVRAGHPAGPGKASVLITFATDSAELMSESRNAVDVVARALMSDRLAGLSFKVEGHADPRGSPEYNQRLSQQRAEAVVSYLVVHHGILAERLGALGKGSSELLDTARPYAPENRRVTIVTERR